MQVFNKLVRDRIPEIIRANGETPVVRVLDDREYLIELIKKLAEEQQELLTAQTAEQQLQELADMYEIVLALARKLHSVEQLEIVRAQKAAERGAFDQKIFLESTQ